MHNEIESSLFITHALHAIEGFFRLESQKNDRISGEKFNQSEFKKIKKDIFKYIGSMEIKDSIKDALKSSLSFANHLTLRECLERLLTSYLSPELISLFLINPKINEKDIRPEEEYAAILSKIRNYYAHLDEKNLKGDIKKIIADPIESYNYKTSILAFLYILLAKDYFEMKNDSFLALYMDQHIDFLFTQPFYEKRINQKAI